MKSLATRETAAVFLICRNAKLFIMEPQIDIFWLLVAGVVTAVVRGLYRRIRYACLKRRRRRADRPVAVLHYLSHPLMQR